MCELEVNRNGNFATAAFLHTQQNRTVTQVNPNTSLPISPCTPHDQSHAWQSPVSHYASSAHLFNAAFQWPPKSDSGAGNDGTPHLTSGKQYGRLHDCALFQTVSKTNHQLQTFRPVYYNCFFPSFTFVFFTTGSSTSKVCALPRLTI